MANSKHYLNNKIVNPRNFQDLEVVVDWENRNDFAVSFSEIELTGSDAQIITDHVNAGNVFEGLPYRIEIGTQSFNGFADLANNLEILGDCPTFEKDIRAWCDRLKKTLLWVRDEGEGAVRVQIQF